MLNPINSLAARTAGAMLLNSSGAGEAGNYVIDLYNKLNVVVTEPLPYESFHLVSIAIILALTVALAYFLRNAKPGVIRGVLFFFWLAMVFTEIVDQFVRSNSLVDGVLVFDYRWHSFPLQLCATGLWLLPFILLLPESRVRDGMMIYMGLYSFFGGLLVCTVPTTVFTTYLVTNIHTMVQHGSQVIVGVLMLVYNRKKLNIVNFGRATLVFLAFVAVAMLANGLMNSVLLAYGEENNFNMFYISPYFNSGMPIIEHVFELVPWGVFVTLYIVCFIAIAFLIYFVAILSMHVADNIRYSRRQKGQENEARQVDSASTD